MEAEAHEEQDSDFDYVESASSSELWSSDEDKDGEKLEAVFGAVFNTSSQSKVFLEPAERQSPPFLDKDFAEHEELVSSLYTHVCFLFAMFLSLHSQIFLDDGSVASNPTSTCSSSKGCGTESQEED